MTRNAAYLLTTCLALSLATCPAFADEQPGQPTAPADTVEAHEAAKEEATKTAYELQQQIEAAQEAYGAAIDEADRIQGSIDETTARIEQLESEIPEQQMRSARATRDQYKLQQQSVGVIDFLLSADNIDDFLDGVEYMAKVSDANMREMNRLVDLKAEIEQTREGMRQSYDEVAARADEASEALASLQEAQAEVQRRIEEEARLAAEIAAQAAALAEHPRDNDTAAEPARAEGSAPDGKREGTAVSNTAAADAPENASEGGSSAEPPAADGESEDPAAGSEETPVEEEAAASDGPEAEEADADADDESEEAASEPLSDEESFIAEWAPRIDAYLAGSPLAGQGATFAKAAFTYNVDPRWSPAISFTESSKGLYCFASHNAWGWGSNSWATWEEAIDAHVGGLSRGYGYTISEDAAKRYCPPTWKSWYDRTLEQMSMI